MMIYHFRTESCISKPMKMAKSVNTLLSNYIYDRFIYLPVYCLHLHQHLTVNCWSALFCSRSGVFFKSILKQKTLLNKHAFSLKFRGSASIGGALGSALLGLKTRVLTWNMQCWPVILSMFFQVGLSCGNRRWQPRCCFKVSTELAKM